MSWLRIFQSLAILPYLSHYPRHMICYHSCLVAKALRNFPQFNRL
nr:MAG TPA: hypothetical protein [Caudoviricetes sp.]